ncbi:thioesterase family protein [Tomitella gaofuii]|uniref:thioesterase family protein n=1 Tax=Tomitella gaofuii TaxID=2760083 RepID=UPI0015FC1C8E|nr:thioesterase family protein [Tomitella gaofuii]
MTEPFFHLLPPLPDDPEDTERVAATHSTSGPWFDGVQHMGPPSALLVRAMERCGARESMRLARLSVNVLGPVPVGELTVSARIDRPGRTIELVSAELRADGRAVAIASGWRHGVTDTAAAATDPGPAMPMPEHGHALPRPDGWLPGYLDAVEWRWLSGRLDEPGPAQVWGRLHVPVVDGEQPTAWQRLASFADSANGAGARLDLNKWLFLNTDLSMHLHRAPAGEWFGLDADSEIGPDGAGTSFARLHDEDGPLGRVALALTVRPR